MVHQKSAPPVEASRHFLESYVQSLLLIKQNPNLDVAKGKQIIGVSLEEIQKQWRDTTLTPTMLKPWSRPPPSWHKLNIDGSFSLQDGGAGIGMVLRDSDGRGIVIACRPILHCSNALEAELVACKEGIELAFQYTSASIIVETDSTTVIHLATSREEDRSTLAHMVREVKLLFTGTRILEIKKVDRSQNKVSQELANHARIHGTSKIWIGQEENVVTHHITDDCISSGFD